MGILAKEQEKFVSLKREPMEVTKAPEGPKDNYPGLYISEVHLPLNDKDINKSRFAEIEFKPRRISTSIVNGKTKESYDLDIVAIKVKN